MTPYRSESSFRRDSSRVDQISLCSTHCCLLGRSSGNKRLWRSQPRVAPLNLARHARFTVQWWSDVAILVGSPREMFMEPVRSRYRSQILGFCWTALLGLVSSGLACSSKADLPPGTFTGTGGDGGEGAAGSSGTAGSGVPTGGAGGGFNLDGGSSGGQSGDGGDPEGGCAAEVAQGEVMDVSMLVMFDKSGSMDDEVSNNVTRWDLASAALNAFFQDPGSAGLNVALRFFPDDVPAAGCNHRDCNENACSQVRVPIGALLADPAPADAQEAALVAAVNATTPDGNTPTYAALAGAELGRRLTRLQIPPCALWSFW